MSLGSIVVRLSMQTADFETDAGRAAKVAQRRAKEIDDAFRKAGTAIGIALGALGAGLALATKSIKDTIDRMDEVSKASQKVGLPTEEFSRLAYAGDLADVSMETMVSSLGKLTKSQAAALDAGSEQAKMFDALGIAITGADGKLRTSGDVLADFADRFAALDGSPEAMAAGFALFGRSFQELIPLLKDGGQAIRDAGAEADALGKTLSTDAGKAAEEFNDNLTRLQSAVGGVWMEIASGMLPQLNEMTGDMVSASKETDNLREFGAGLSTVLQGLGSGFAFVAGMAKQFTIDTLALSDALMGYAEAARNIGSLGLASGTVSGGLNRANNAFDTRRQLMQDAARARANAAAQANIDRLMSRGVAYNGPLLDMGKPAADPAEEYRKRLAAVLGGGSGSGSRKSGGASRKAELSDEAKEMQRLNEQAARDLENLKERLGLMGLETEAARMKWQTEEGAYKALDPLKKAELIAQAALVDAKEKALEIAERERRDAEEAKKSFHDVIGNIREEAETLGMSNDQLEVYNNLKRAGVDAGSAWGRQIIAETQALQEQRAIMEDQVAMMDGVRGAAQGFLDDLYDGVSLWDALGNAAKRFADTLFDIASQNLIEQIFGKQGSAGGGSMGGWLGALFGSLFGSGSAGAAAGGGQFGWAGAGYARGGYTGAGGVNEVAGAVHRGEVVWSQGDIARAGGVANVEAMRRGGAGEAPSRVTTPVVVIGDRAVANAMAGLSGRDVVMTHVRESIDEIRGLLA